MDDRWTAILKQRQQTRNVVNPWTGETISGEADEQPSGADQEVGSGSPLTQFTRGDN